MAAIAAFSDSAAIGMCATCVAGREDVRRAAPARSPPTTIVASPAERPGDSASGVRAARVERDERAGQQRRAPPRPRERHVEDRAHARPHRLGAERVGACRGPGRRSPAPKACAARMIVPTLPGSRDAVEVDAPRRRRARPSAPRRRRGSACRCRGCSRPASSSGSTSVPVQPAARRRRSARAPVQPAACAASTRSSPSATKRRGGPDFARPWAVRSLRRSLRWRLSGLSIMGPGTRKGAVLEGSGAR